MRLLLKKGGIKMNNERTFTGLRRFNAVMGLLHLVQGGLMIVLSNDTTYPITTAYLKFDFENFNLYGSDSPRLAALLGAGLPAAANTPQLAAG